ncbi:FMN-binding protein [candidate division WOR-3 bacterium]|nr:FMN-binding protein [candidate division WOR-3 bacterium]
MRLKSYGGTIDAITAATISSRAVTDGVRKGIEKFSTYLHYE